MRAERGDLYLSAYTPVDNQPVTLMRIDGDAGLIHWGRKVGNLDHYLEIADADDTGSLWVRTSVGPVGGPESNAFMRFSADGVLRSSFDILDPDGFPIASSIVIESTLQHLYVKHLILTDQACGFHKITRDGSAVDWSLRIGNGPLIIGATPGRNGTIVTAGGSWVMQLGPGVDHLKFDLPAFAIPATGYSTQPVTVAVQAQFITQTSPDLTVTPSLVQVTDLTELASSTRQAPAN